MTEKEKYRISTYHSIGILHETTSSKVEIVENSLDGLKYIMKTYHSDKRSIFHCLAEIKNAHIPEVYEVFFGEDTIIIEQYISGSTLEQIISDKKSLTRKEINQITDSLLDAVDTLHKNNIVHRDIKPSNIIIKENKEAVLIDYSIARQYSDKLDSDTELFGTVGYAAPEQFGYSQSDYRTDIYALGVTLKKIVNSNNSSKIMRDAISQCVEFDPSRRFQSIDEIRKYLRKSKTIIIPFAVVFVLLILTSLIIMNKQNSKENVESVTQNNYENTISTTHFNEESTTIAIREDYFYTNGIIDTSLCKEGVPYIRMWNNGVYETTIPGTNDLFKVTATKQDNDYSIIINDKSFELKNIYSQESLSYSGGQEISELVFYDMNNDDINDIILVTCNAVISDSQGQTTILRNYSVAWCIYSDAKGEYRLADTEMYSIYDPFRIYDSAPGCLWADFPNYYKFDENNKLVLLE